MALDLSGLTQDQQIAKAAAYAGVPESIVRGQWRVESGNGRARKDADGVIRSKAGAQGDFQVMPTTQAVIEARTGKKYDVTNFQDNLEMYAHIMQENMQLAKGDVTNALRIYQGGTNKRNWGAENAAYAPSVLGGASAPAVAPSVPSVSQSTADLNAAWQGAGNMTTRTWSGASIPDAWTGAPIEGRNALATAAKEHIGKIRAGIAELSMGQVAQEGGTAAEAVGKAQAVRASDEVVPWWVRQEVDGLNTEARKQLLNQTENALAQDRADEELRNSLQFTDKWGAAFDSGIGAAISNQLAREDTDIPEDWVYDPKEWEKPWMTADELEDIRDASYSPNELAYVSNRQYTRRYSMRIKDQQTGWGSFGYDMVAGFTDPGNWAVGGVTGLGAKTLGVGSAALLAEGRVGAALSAAAAENAVGSVLTDVALVGMGERRNFADFLTDAAFATTIGTAMHIPGARTAAQLRDKATLDLSANNAAAYGEAWSADLRARAVTELGESASPVVINNRVHQLAKGEMVDWLRASMADVPDDFRVFARPDVEEVTTTGTTGALARDVDNVDPSTGKYRDDVGGASDLAVNDPLLERAWKTAGIKGDINGVLQYLESTRAVPEDFRAIANALKRSGRLNDVKVLPTNVLDQWFASSPDPSRVAGGFNPGANAMAMRVHSPEGVLHEMLHAATFRELRTNKAFSDEMEELLMHINNSVGSVDSSLVTAAMDARIEQGATGFMSSADELITYGLSNRNVQAVLRQMPAPGNARISAWEWLKDKIARVMGLKDQESALERLMSVVGENLGEEVRDSQATSRQTRGMLANSIFKSNRERKAFYKRSGLDTSVSDDAMRVQIAEVMARAERFSGKYSIDAAKLNTIMQRFGLEATSTTMMSSQSSVARMLAITLLENPEGAAGRHTTAAMDRHGRFESFVGSRPRQWEAAYRLWRADVRKIGAIKDFATGWQARADFEYAVKLYRETRFMGADMEVHDAVKQMARSIDEGYNRMAAEQRAAGTVGAQRLPEQDVEGYESRTWLGGSIAAAGPARRESIRRAMREQFEVMGELYGDDFLDKFATRYLERIERKAAGIVQAPGKVFSENNADTLRDTLRSLSLNEEEIQKVMGKYSRGGAKHTKSRIDLDVTKQYTDKEGKFRLMDYLDNRVMDNYRKYAGRVAGDISLAKHGILGDAGINVAREAMRLTGANDVELRAFDQVMSEFLGRAVGTGDPTVLANARLLTSAIQLGGAGINQAAEYSNGLAAVGAAGVAEAVSIAPRMRGEIMRILKGEESGNDILTGFEFISGRGFGLAGYDLHMFNSLDTQASMYGSERAGFMTALVQKAAHANRILSGQRAVLAVQQRGFAEVLIAKGVKFLRDGTEADIAMKDMGIDDVLLNRLRATQDKVVKWGADGKLEAVDPRNVEGLADRQAWLSFYNAISRGTSQILQDTFIGETGKWAHNGWLKMLFQHRTFSLVAQQKQLGRYVGNYGAWKTAGLIGAAMAVAAPLQALRVASRVALMDDADRDKAIDENIMSPLALGKATLNYVSATGMLNDLLDVGTGVAGGWYEYAADTEGPSWLKQLAGGQFGNRKEVVGGQFAPALGVINDFAQGVAGRPENLADVIPGGRLPMVIPLLKGAGSQWKEE